MDYIETWFKAWCPKCKAANWVCDGDPSDVTGVDIEAIKCWKCNHSWWLDEDFVVDMHGKDATPEDYAEDGTENPR